MFLAGCTLLVFVVLALKHGEIWRFSKYHTGLVTLSEHPGSFWVSAIFSSIFGLWFIGSSVWIFKKAFKKIRK